MKTLVIIGVIVYASLAMMFRASVDVPLSKLNARIAAIEALTSGR